MLCLVLSLITFVIFYVVPRQQRVQRLQGRFVDIQRAQQFSGRSYVSRQAVSQILLDAKPVTLSLTIGGAVIWMLIAVPLGVFSALWPRSSIDRTATVLVLIGISTHPLWLGLVLSYLLGNQLHAPPVAGYCDMFNSPTTGGGPVQWFTHLLMPGSRSRWCSPPSTCA
jgi:ABC-type dipeptide/oligopeptide/nickel transport system permease component